MQPEHEQSAPHPMNVVLPRFAGAIFALSLVRALWETWPVTFASLWSDTIVLLVIALVGAELFVVGWRRWRIEAIDFLPFYLLLISAITEAVDVLRLWVLLAGSVLLAAVFWMRRVSQQRQGFRVSVRQRAIIASLVVGGGVFGVYLLTLGRYVGRADTFEFQVTAPVLGIAHPTGYPLYIILGKLTSLVPFGSMAWRVNLSAAIPAALAALVLAEVIRRLNVGRLLAVLAALTLAFSQTYWSQAVEAEVYALNALFVVVILGILMDGLYRTDPRFGGQGEMPVRSVYALALAFGLGLTNHLTLVLLAPAAALALWSCRPKLTLRQWGIAAGLFGAGLLVYLYILLRWPAIHDGAWMPLDEFAKWVTGYRFGGALLPEYFSQPERWETIGRLIVDQFGPVGLVLGVVGLARLARWFPGMGTVTLVAYGAYFVYALIYIIPDIEVFLIPLHIIQVIWMAYAIHAISEWAGKLHRRLARGRGYVPLHTAVALLPLSLLWLNGAAMREVPHRGEALDEWGRYVLSLPLDEGAAILADSEKIAPLEYLHRIEDARPDMEMIVLGNEALYHQVLGERLAAGQTVYLARYLPGLESVYHLRSAGPLVEVGTEPLTEPPAGMTALDAVFGGWAKLLGYAVDDTHVQIGEAARVTLYWQREGEATGAHQVWLRLVDLAERNECIEYWSEIVGEDTAPAWCLKTSKIVWQSDDRYAVNNTYPANAWKEGEVIPDYYEVQFEHGILPGAYRLEVGLFEPFATEGLPLASQGEEPVEWAEVATFEVALADAIPEPSVQVRHRLSDDLLITGYDMPDSATEDTPMPVKIYLRALDDLTEELVFFDVAALGIGFVDAMPPLQAGEGIVLAFTPYASPLYTLRVKLDDSDSWFYLPDIPIQPAPPESLANFDGRALLLDARQSTNDMQPGDLLDVFLTWEALARFEDDYTVFVQLVGPDGRPHGQSDAFPVQGTYPTSRWQVGERIDDAYRLQLDADAPPGDYEIHLGFYLLATSERLPVIGETGAEIANRYILGTVNVVGR